MKLRALIIWCLATSSAFAHASGKYVYIQCTDFTHPVLVGQLDLPGFSACQTIGQSLSCSGATLNFSNVYFKSERLVFDKVFDATKPGFAAYENEAHGLAVTLTDQAGLSVTLTLGVSADGLTLLPRTFTTADQDQDFAKVRCHIAPYAGANQKWSAF